MKKNLTELVIILDRSGSMCGLESDVVGGFNSLIESQKKTEGEVIVSTILFNDREKTIHSRVNINEINNLQSNDYVTSGCTALLDAVGHAITNIKNVHEHINEDAVPENVIFSIMTDGLENASREFTKSMVKELIESQKKKGWNFIFQGANIDAVKEGTALGIDHDDIASFKADKRGMVHCFCAMDNMVREKRIVKKSKAKK